jgi:hypothetical protein
MAQERRSEMLMEHHPKTTVLQYVDERRQVLRGRREREL